MDKSMHASVMKVVFLFIALLFMLFVFPYTYSRYESMSSSEISSSVAYYILDTNPISENIRLDNIVPASSPYVFNFTVSNFDGDNRLETILGYDLKIRTTTNLPLVYELYMNEDYENPSATQIVNKEIVQDEDGTYFRVFNTPRTYFNYFYDEINEYTLVIYFPTEYKTYNYQGVIDSIELSIDSEQIIDSTLTVLSGLVLRLDAASITGVEDNSPVELWEDLSGNENHALQPNESERPLFVENQMNGNPVIRYDGNTNLSILDDSTLQIDSEITIFAVVNLDSTTTGTSDIRTITSKELSHTDRNWWLVQWDERWAFRQSGMGSNTVESDSVASTEPTLITVSGDGASMKMFVDGDEQTSSVNYSSLDVQEAGVGVGRQSDTTSRNWVGDIAELIIYDSSLSNAEREVVENYLGHKWLNW